MSNEKISSGEDNIENSQTEVSSLVESNMQKLFLAHIRLRKISKLERDTIVKAYCQKLSATDDSTLTSESETSPPLLANTTTERTNANNTISSPLDESEVQQYEIASTLTNSEVEAIRKAIDSLDTVEKDESRVSRMGPRSIRSFINKYQLARFLLNELYPRVVFAPDQLAGTLACCMDEPNAQSTIEYPPPNEPLSDNFKIRLVCLQVA